MVFIRLFCVVLLVFMNLELVRHAVLPPCCHQVLENNAANKAICPVDESHANVGLNACLDA